MTKLVAALVLYLTLLLTGWVGGCLAGTPLTSLAATVVVAPVLLCLVPRGMRARVRVGLGWLDELLTGVEYAIWRFVKWMVWALWDAIKHGEGI